MGCQLDSGGVSRGCKNPGGKSDLDLRVRRGFLEEVTSGARHAESMGRARPKWMRASMREGTTLQVEGTACVESQAREPRRWKGQEVARGERVAGGRRTTEGVGGDRAPGSGFVSSQRRQEAAAGL